MKYERKDTVDAIYTDYDGIESNYLIEAMPEMMTEPEFFKSIESYPAYSEHLTEKSPEQRQMLIPTLNRIFYPMDYMYYIYDMLYRAIIENYTSQNTIKSIMQINALYFGREHELEYMTHSYSGSILGAPGIGKTSTIKRSLATMPQVIVHTNYKNQKMYEKQILYLFVESPSDCSVKTIANGILMAIDKAIESKYAHDLAATDRGLVIGRLTERVKIACLRHHVGVIVIDEIQNAVVTASMNRQIKPLIKFLIELTNEACVSTCFCGTLLAEELFVSQDHLKRRTRGLRLTPFRYDVTYKNFLKKIWTYQYTLHKTPLTERLANMIYACTGGVPAYVLKLFAETQTYAILTGTETVTETEFKIVMKRMQFDTQIRYTEGTSISDFYVNKQNITETDAVVAESIQKKRGRPVVKRDKRDLIELYKNANSLDEMIETLKVNHLYERM